LRFWPYLPPHKHHTVGTFNILILVNNYFQAGGGQLTGKETPSTIQ